MSRPSGNCPFCGTWRLHLHRDHIVPKFAGGQHTPDNFQYICANCHEDKSWMERKGNSWSKGRVVTEETRRRLKKAATGNSYRKGKTFTKESREKISSSLRKFNSSSFPVGFIPESD